MKYLSFFFLAFLLLWGNISEAQNSGNIHKNYQNGKELFQAEKYELAMQVFSPLARQDAGNPYTEYASYFYALAAYHSGKTDLAKNMLLQIDQKYNSWHDIDEARFWLSKVYFEENELVKGVSTLSKIRDKSLKEEADNMKLHFLQEADDVQALAQLNEKFPKDKDIATAFAEALYTQPILERDQKLLDKVIKQHSLDPQAYTSGLPAVSQKKDVYNVAVLMPFFVNDLSKGKNLGNQFVVDLYEAIQLGNQKLKSEGININLYAYDTKRDSATTAQILKLKEMRTMDLIVGPLYPTTSRLASEFSQQHKINMINPISNNSKVIGNNQFSFLFKPSYETQAKRAAEFASKEFLNNKAIIIYGTSQRDSILATNYKSEAERRSMEVVTMVKVDASESRKALELLTLKEETHGKIPPNSIGHIFVTSLDEVTVANVLNGLDHREDKISLIGFDEWLDFRSVSYDQMERFKIYFIAPNYINYAQPEVERFRNKYIENTKSLPTQFSYAGYETMIFAGRMLNRYGNYFQKELENAGFVPGAIFPGYNFANSNDNQFVPIIRFAKSDLVIVNHPLYSTNDRQAEK